MDELGSWSDFNLALATGSAALAGLVLVAVSVNIRTVLKHPGISGRATSALALLVLSLVASMIALLPGQSVLGVGIMTLVCSAVAWVIGIRGFLALVRDRPTPDDTGQPPARGAQLGGNAVLFIGPLVLFTIGAVLMVIGHPSGEYWVAIGSILALVCAVVFSWVALVEVLR